MTVSCIFILLSYIKDGKRTYLILILGYKALLYCSSIEVIILLHFFLGIIQFGFFSSLIICNMPVNNSKYYFIIITLKNELILLHTLANFL